MRAKFLAYITDIEGQLEIVKFLLDQLWHCGHVDKWEVCGVWTFIMNDGQNKNLYKVLYNNLMSYSYSMMIYV